jgi:peptidoglycan/LPS O-acetylase OafA/YrhL
VFKAVAIAAILFGAVAIAAYGVWGALLGRGLMGFFAGVLVLRNLELLKQLPAWLLVPAALIPAVAPPDGAWLIATTLLAWPAAILLALRIAWLASPAMIWLGDRSYAVYLLHVPVYTLLGNLALQGGANGTVTWLAITGAAWGLILLLANIAYMRLERAAQTAIRSWAGRAKPALA